MSEKRTNWFKSGTIPELIGSYETLPEADDRGSDPDPWFQFWNGKFWGRIENTAAEAAREKRRKSIYQRPRWRGLAHKPESA